MIARLSGTLVEAGALEAVIDCHGVGYHVHVPLTTAEKLPPAGEAVTLFTVAVYREDSAALYGFARREDEAFFRLLVEKVSGVGPKLALNILSRMSTESLRGALASGDIALLSKIPGIGKKTAERLVVELRDKMALPGEKTAGSVPSGAGVPAAGSPEGSAFGDAVHALITLGYKAPEADKAIRKAREKLGESAGTEELLRTALRG